MGLMVELGAGEARAAGPPPPPPPPPSDEPDEPVVTDDEPDEPVVSDDEPDDPVVTDDGPDEPEDEPDQPDEPTTTAADVSGAVGTDPADARADRRRRRRNKNDEDDSEDDEDNGRKWWKSKYLTLGGYVQPQYTYRVRRNARPRDQQEFGADQTRAGIRFSGEPIKHWSYKVHLVFGRIDTRVTDIGIVDFEGDGALDQVFFVRERGPGLFIEELSIDYRPVDYHGKNPDAEDPRDVVALDIKFGQMRIPFTAQNRSPNSALMFPRRSTPNNVFLFGTDLGGLVKLGILDDTVDILGGVYNGTGLAVSEVNSRGALYAGRLDINPLGGFPYAEGDLGRGGFKFGVGGGLLYYPSKLFDDAGNDTRTRARDLRASASFRMQVKGFYLQGEFLRRQRTDSLSSLPLIATGAYGQTSFFFPVYKNLGAAPVGRFGWTTLDQSFDPRVTYYGDAGAALYIGNNDRPDVLRVLLQYVGEVRVTEQEQAHGAALQVQLKW